MPKVIQRDPKSGQFDVIDPDSADEDFEHEYDELCQNNNSDRGSDNSSQQQFAHLPENSAIASVLSGGRANQTYQVTT